MNHNQNHNQNQNQNQNSLDRISLDKLIDGMQRFKNDLLSHSHSHSHSHSPSPSSHSSLPPFDWNFIQSITHLILVAQDLRECVENGNLEEKKKEKKKYNDSSGFTNASYTPSRERKRNEENQNKKEMSFQERLHKIVLQFDALRTVQTKHSY